MRYGIFSDTHSNLEAFESVLKAMEGERLDRYICAGDIVGYGADFSRCIELTKEITDDVVCGNHDWGSVGLFDATHLNPRAKAAVEWTAGRLNEAEKEYLKGLKLIHEEDNFVVVHGSLHEPERFNYILDLSDAIENFYLMRKRLCFIGHTHSTVVFSKSGEDASYTRSPKIKLAKDASYIVNVGSVGQPRDGDPRACYVVYDEDEDSLEIRRVTYNIGRAQNKILNAGLPASLAERLSVGV